MPPIVLAILSGVEALIAEAPQIIAIGQKAKEFFTSLVEGGIITNDQQDSLHARVDQVTSDFQNGKVPPAWTVEPD